MKNIIFYCFSHGKKAWYLKQKSDLYVRKAQQQNYRSRASFKLLQIHQKYNIIGQFILDLGCSPGGWSQVVKRLKPNSTLVSVDILQMQPIQGVHYFKEDARSQKFHNILKKQFKQFDTIISDMAPNFSGDNNETHEEIIELNNVCILLCLMHGKAGCNLVMKTIQGIYEKNMFNLAYTLFQKVHRVKPASSRSESIEFYYVCNRLKKIYARNKRIIEIIEKISIVQKIQKKSLQKKLSQYI